MTSYPPSHPWHYLLRRAVLCPRTIRAYADVTGYGRYRANEIATAARLPSPGAAAN